MIRQGVVWGHAPSVVMSLPQSRTA